MLNTNILCGFHADDKCILMSHSSSSFENGVLNKVCKMSIGSEHMYTFYEDIHVHKL